MRLGILGQLEVTGADGPVVVGGARLRVLLIRLALEVGRPVSTEALAAALWGDQPPSDPANAVHSLVSRLRRVLPEADVLRSAPGGYRLDLPGEAVDATQFERLAAEGRRALRAGDPPAAADALRRALALWRGEALADAGEAGFAVAVAARMSQLRLVATEDLLEAELASGDVDAVVPRLEELAAAHPLRERPQALLVTALYSAGRQVEALAAYDRLRVRLADELGIDPSPELRELHRAVLRGELPVAVRGAARGNLRAALTSFVGRAQDRRQVAARLAASRLVTLVGPGGAGKTRLATTVGEDLAERTAGGVWLVDLAAVTDPADLPAAVLGALERPELRFSDARPSTGPGEPVSRLVERLAAAPTVLLLDNCEHLVEAVARLVDELVGRCPRLRILATSREPLGLIGEALYPVPPLGLPEPGMSAEAALGYPAVQLFADRAAAVRPGFTVDDANVAVVVEVCRRLDGLPLAIELAAARLRSLSPAQLAKRLDDRFRLLAGGSRTALPRHRTLRAVVDWSWDLLGEDERVLARRLAVFPAGATPAAAEAVCADEQLPAKAVADLLDALADKSLLQVVDDGEEPRYRMLDTIREYAAERLAEAGETATVRAAHVAYFLSLAETAEPRLRRAEQLEWFGRLTDEQGNLLAALHAACDRGDAASAVRLAGAMVGYFMMLGNHADALSWLQQALAVPGDSPPAVRALVEAAYLINGGIWGRQSEEQAARAEAVLARIADLEQPPPHPLLVLVEPMIAMSTDDTARGLAIIDRRQPAEDPWAAAMLHLLRSFIHENDGDPAGRRTELATAAGMFRELGERWGLGTALGGLAEVQAQLGEFDDAIATLEESVRLMHELGATEDAVEARTRLSIVWARRGDVDRARAELRALLQPGPGEMALVRAGFARFWLAELARQAGDLAEAGELYRVVLTEFEQMPRLPLPFSALVHIGLGQLALARGDLPAAESHLDQALTVAQDSKDIPILAAAAIAVAELWLRRGQPGRAAELLGVAEALRGGPDRLNADVPRVAEATRQMLGDAEYGAAYARGRSSDRPRALALLDAAPTGG